MVSTLPFNGKKNSTGMKGTRSLVVNRIDSDWYRTAMTVYLASAQWHAELHFPIPGHFPVKHNCTAIPFLLWQNHAFFPVLAASTERSLRRLSGHLISTARYLTRPDQTRSSQHQISGVQLPVQNGGEKPCHDVFHGHFLRPVETGLLLQHSRMFLEETFPDGLCPFSSPILDL